MKIKLQDYSLISNEWIDIEINKALETGETEGYVSGFVDALLMLKQQLIPSNKLARMSWEDGHYIGTHFVDNKTSELHKEHFLTSEIEIL
jgi:hypothetical protein